MSVKADARGIRGFKGESPVWRFYRLILSKCTRMASFFHTLRDDFPDYLDDAARQNPDVPLWRRLAKVGFSLISTEKMDDADANYIGACLRRFPDSQAAQAFAALALGVLMGKLDDDQISEIDMICEQDDLQIFVRENLGILEDRWGETHV